MAQPTKHQRERARRLRREMSKSQKKLWQELRAHRTGFHFRREYPVGPYMLDFYCNDAKLCVEFDGEQHGETVEKDHKRDAFLLEQGILTVRYRSIDCFKDSACVAEDVRLKCVARSERDPDSAPS